MITVKIRFVLMILIGSYGHLVYINGTFLLSNFKSDINTHKEKEIHMEVPEGFHKFLPIRNCIFLPCYAITE